MLAYSHVPPIKTVHFQHCFSFSEQVTGRKAVSSTTSGCYSETKAGTILLNMFPSYQIPAKSNSVLVYASHWGPSDKAVSCSAPNKYSKARHFIFTIFPPPSLQNKDAFVTLAVHKLATVLVAFQWHPDAMITAAGAGWRACRGGKWVVILRGTVLHGGVWKAALNIWGTCSIKILIVPHNVWTWKRGRKYLLKKT